MKAQIILNWSPAPSKITLFTHSNTLFRQLYVNTWNVWYRKDVIADKLVIDYLIHINQPIRRYRDGDTIHLINVIAPEQHTVLISGE